MIHSYRADFGALDSSYSLKIYSIAPMGVTTLTSSRIFDFHTIFFVLKAGGEDLECNMTHEVIGLRGQATIRLVKHHLQTLYIQTRLGQQ